ncbi:MAG: alpha 1,2 mannosyltransferase [Vezdaea acicularis]|nr:MAG: alpha 1,2 mannosyltransferase [Vezdaea acicularis]
MLLLRWVWIGSGNDEDVTPAVVFWTLRILMFALSFVLEDWAIHELVPSPRQRRIAVLLVASSYVTWTYQTHTFSNSIETLLVAWSLVLIQRIVDNRQRSSLFASGLLAFLVVFGVFNRITFPAFLVIPGLRLFPHFVRKPLTLLSMVLASAVALFFAIYSDTSFYTTQPVTLKSLYHNPVITPLNNLRYNLDPTNLAKHGLHPHYQHLVANLPLLLGPAFLLLLSSPRPTLRLASAISGVLVLSLSQHQEARFLIPAIPLILSSIDAPKRNFKTWIAAWLAFNLAMAALMGIYHQGGVIPSQINLASSHNITETLWWKTYSPPIWILDGKNADMTTTDLMGMPPHAMIAELEKRAVCNSSRAARTRGTCLVAPASAAYLDRYTMKTREQCAKGDLFFEKTWEYRKHLNLDDMDFGTDGVWSTLARVLGRRGLVTWKVSRNC